MQHRKKVDFLVYSQKNNMKKNIFFLLTFIFFFGFSSVSAQECNFPKSKITADEILWKIEQCKTARSNNTTNAIEDFSCPAWEFTLKDNLQISDERLSYHIAVNLLMNEADENIKKYMKELQKNRNTDNVAWTENMTACIHGSPKSKAQSIKEIYTDICNFTNILTLLNNNSQWKVILGTTEFLPQKACHDIASKKIKAWDILGKNFMQSGIHKSHQNARNKFIDNIQWKYRAILEKFHDYQKIIFRSSSKVDRYIQNPVK